MSVRRTIDWTGTAPATEPIAPLTPETFVARLNALSAAVNGLAKLEKAFADQNPRYARRLPHAARESRRDRA